MTEIKNAIISVIESKINNEQKTEKIIELFSTYSRIPMQNIVERLEEEKEEKLREYKEFLDGEDYRQSLLLDKAIEIVKEEGGLHELSS